MFISRGLGIALSLVFGGLLLALVAELYYLLRWKKIRTSGRSSEEDYTAQAEQLFCPFCWKKPSSINDQSNNDISTIPTNPDANSHDPDIEMGTSKDMLLKAFGEDGVESEIMRLQNLAGPPRFLFTINEETKEDLESDDGKSKGDRSRKGSRTGSLSDLILAVEAPFLSPLSSPPLKASTALNPLHSYSRHGFNPLFESSLDAELNRLRASPPPKFKFLRDAEEKLYKRLLGEAEKSKVRNNGGCRLSDAKGRSLNSSMAAVGTDYRDGPSVKVFVGNSEAREINEYHHPQQKYHASSSQFNDLPHRFFRRLGLVNLRPPYLSFRSSKKSNPKS
ncbi:hypothetical protein Nepgr_000089 [Nepenthes gracilis]|uniref:Uncharacterized protein n=1 Tax=Nepenthes gracilis TaxID=150966 RepID=A0AAD3RWC6_NEPGR|nr:hypothetical protein Nepgr_000089 [Nepenthes gracilis]